MNLRCSGALVLLAVGCDDLPQGPGDTGDTGVDVNSLASATQVGSEGFWDCPIEAMQAIADPSLPIEALGGSPIDLVAARDGAWWMTIIDEGDPVQAVLHLVDAGAYRLAEVTDGTGCVDHLVAEVTANLTRQNVTRSLTGFVAVRPDAGRLVLSEDDLAGVGLLWGVPTLAGAVAFRIEGDLEPVSFSGAASYVDCADPIAACASAEVLATVTGTR